MSQAAASSLLTPLTVLHAAWGLGVSLWLSAAYVGASPPWSPVSSLEFLNFLHVFAIFNRVPRCASKEACPLLWVASWPTCYDPSCWRLSSNYYRRNALPGQGCVLHSTASDKSSHSPPVRPAVLERLRMAPPQVAEQAIHSPQSLQSKPAAAKQIIELNREVQNRQQSLLLLRH